MRWVQASGTLVAVLWVAAAGCGYDDRRPRDPVDDGDDPPPQVEAVPPRPASAPSPGVECANGRLERVHSIVDGDTLNLERVKDGRYERVRLVGIDTPEVFPEPDCFGPEATEATRRKVDRAEVCLVLDPAVEAESGSLDRFGRTLAYVFFGTSYERFLNGELVEEGFATAFPFTPGAAYARWFASLEARAWRLKLGMWDACVGDAR